MADTYVNGRRLLLQALDSVLAEEKNIKLFKEAFQTNIETDALRFLQNIVMPLMPKDTNIEASDEDKASVVTIEYVPAVAPTPTKE